MQRGLHFAYTLLVFFFLQDLISAQPSIQFQGLQGVSVLYFCNTVQHRLSISYFKKKKKNTHASGNFKIRLTPRFILFTEEFYLKVEKSHAVGIPFYFFLSFIT